MKKLFITLVIALLGIVQSYALQINVSVGALKSSESLLRNTQDATVILRGKANVTDLALLKHLSPSVKMLDMSNLTIEAYSNAKGGYYGKSSFDEGEIPAYMLMSTSIEEIVFPANVRVIGKGAFSSTSLKQLIIPSSVISVEDYAFAGNKSLVEVKVLSNTSFGKAVFKECSALRSVNFESDIIEISESMFDGCKSYQGPLPNSVRKIGSYAYRATGIETADLSNVEEIGAYSFADMPALKEVTLKTDSNIRIGEGAFFNNALLGNLPIAGGEISDLMGAHTSVNIPVIDCENVGIGAFANNVACDSITFGPKVKSIGEHAFRNMQSLRGINAVSLGSYVPHVEETSFSGLEDEAGTYDIYLNVESGKESVWKSNPIWGRFKIGSYRTSVESIETLEPGFDIERGAGYISVSCTHDIASVCLISVAGNIEARLDNCGKNVQISCLDKEPKILMIFAADVSKTIKIM